MISGDTHYHNHSNPGPYTIFDKENDPSFGYNSMDAYYTEDNLPQFITDYGEDHYLIEEVKKYGFFFDDLADEENILYVELMLTQWMEEVVRAPEVQAGRWLADRVFQWHILGEHLGWQGQSGHKECYARSGRNLLKEILPNTECTYQLWKCQDAQGHSGIAIRNSHHDAMGEIYYIFPVRDYESESYEDHEE